jgi:HD superfamily phosphohydrolase YqeK
MNLNRTSITIFNRLARRIPHLKKVEEAGELLAEVAGKTLADIAGILHLIGEYSQDSRILINKCSPRTIRCKLHKKFKQTWDKMVTINRLR